MDNEGVRLSGDSTAGEESNAGEEDYKINREAKGNGCDSAGRNNAASGEEMISSVKGDEDARVGWEGWWR